MATELRKVGAEVEEGHDTYIFVSPPAAQHADIGTCSNDLPYGDGCLSDTPVTITDLNVPQKRS